MRRFFAPDSFWNQPIPTQPGIDPESERYLQFMHDRDPRGFWINLAKWTIPIYEVSASTPRRRVHRRFSLANANKGLLQRSAGFLHDGHPLGFGKAFAADAEAGLIPIPDDAVSDPESDAHLALVDWSSGWAWDMWKAIHRPDGEWESNTGMKYRIDGSGVFDRSEFATHNGESIHAHGPGRAAGVPILAGTILHEEILAGRIEHKLAFATQAAALQRFVYPPATWTDGGWRRGIPEGSTVQLDPGYDLAGLPPAARTIARALQEYGAVCVDVSGGHCLYGQGLYGDKTRSWSAVLASDAVLAIPLKHYRVLAPPQVIEQGMGPRVPDGVYAGEE